MTWQAHWVSQTSGFADATRILEVGAGGFETSVYLARRFPEKEFVGLDFTLSPLALKTLGNGPSNLTVVKHDARNMRIFAEGYFDFIFSVAVMEHIAELADHLEETARILRKDGLYCFWQAPFWSCSKGHHFRHDAPDCPIPPYSHLHLTQSEMREQLIERGIAPDEAGDIAEFIYARGDLSRLGRSQTRAIIEDSPFEIAQWEDQDDDRYNPEGVSRVMARNLYGLPENDLRFKGAKVRLVCTKS